MLPELVDQWINESKNFNNNIRIVRYFGKAKEYDGDTVTTILDPISRDHELFNGSEESAETLVISTVQTVSSEA